MNRRSFIGTLSAGVIMTGLGLKHLLDNKTRSEKMPSIFIGHGSPMNALASNPFTKTLNNLGQSLPRPEAILVISAHWMTRGTWVTQMEKPKTIHDFYGFPQALFDVQYPASGAPELAPLVQASASPEFQVGADTSEWGLDHGTWSVLKHMYPEADIPVLQLSLDMTQGPDYHFELGKQIAKLREKGVMILGSGNIVHNLRAIRWGDDAKPHEWALEFDQWMKEKLEQKDYKALQFDFLNSEAGKLSNPSLDHYYPMLYALGAGANDGDVKFEYEEIQNGSLSMRSFRIG